MTPEEIKRYFTDNPPPKEVNWTAHARITDSSAFLIHSFILIDNHKGNLETCPAWWRLRDFFHFMKNMNTAEKKM